MTDKMMRIAGRGEDGLAKSVKTNNSGEIITESKINGNKRLVRMYHGVNLNPSLSINLKQKIESNLIEIVVVASELNREVLVSPGFGVYEHNLKETITQNREYTQFLMGEGNSREASFLLQAVGDKIENIYLESTDGNPINVDVFIWEVFTPVKNYGKYVYKEVVASISLNSTKVDVSEIKFISNDGTADVLVGLNQFLVPNVKIRLKPGETLNNIDIPMQKFFYQSISGEQPIRIMGVK